MYSYTLNRWGLKYSGDTYASYRSKSATRLVGIYKRSNSEQLLNEESSAVNIYKNDANKLDVWKSEDDLSRLSYKGIAPKPRKSLPDNCSFSQNIPTKLSASWSPHFDSTVRQPAVTSDTDEEESECLISVKQRIQRLEETKKRQKQTSKNGQKKRTPPPVPDKPRSLSLRGGATDFPTLKTNPPNSQCNKVDADQNSFQKTPRFKSTSDLREVDQDSGVFVEPNVTPSLHWMLSRQQSPSKFKNLYSEGRSSDPDISKLKDFNNKDSMSFRQGCFSQVSSNDGYGTLPGKRRRPMRASTGSAPTLALEESQSKTKDSALIFQPSPIKPRSPKPVARNSSGYHTLPRSSATNDKTNLSSLEKDAYTENETSDEDGGFHEDPDVSLSKSQIECMSSSFPRCQTTSKESFSKDPENRKLSVDNTIIGDTSSLQISSKNRSPSPRRFNEVSSPKLKPKPKQRNRQMNKSKNLIVETGSNTESLKRTNLGRSHSRRPSQEELEFEEIAKDLSQNLEEESDKELINVLSPNNKRATDFVKDLLEITHFNTKLLPEICKENAENHDSQESQVSLCNNYNPVIANKSTTSIYRQTDNKQNEESLIQKKEELRISIVKKLDALQENKMKVEKEMEDVNNLGEKIGKLFDESCENSQEKNKFRSYVEDLEMVIRLLMKVSVLLARAENNIRCLPTEADQRKRNRAVEKRNRFSQQHEEAKQLKSDIDRRQEHITNLLGQYLSRDDLKEFHYYINMKLRLIVELQELEDKIYQGEEQLVALKRSIPLNLTSLSNSNTSRTNNK